MVAGRPAERERGGQRLLLLEIFCGGNGCLSCESVSCMQESWSRGMWGAGAVPGGVGGGVGGRFQQDDHDMLKYLTNTPPATYLL